MELDNEAYTKINAAFDEVKEAIRMININQNLLFKCHGYRLSVLDKYSFSSINNLIQNNVSSIKDLLPIGIFNSAPENKIKTDYSGISKQVVLDSFLNDVAKLAQSYNEKYNFNFKVNLKVNLK